MAIEAAPSPEQTYDPGPCHTDWKDEAWRAFIGSTDALLRAYYRIEEFTDDPRCILRIGLMQAVMPVVLTDGTEIRKGERIGALHLWNEHVPRYAGNGPNLPWAKEMRRRMLWSLGLLADYIQHDPDWQHVQAFCGDSMLSSRIGGAQLRRLAPRYGFEIVERPPTLSRYLQTFADSLIVWGLTRAFNPAALPRRRFLRDHHKVWISCAALRQLYGREAQGATPEAAVSERAFSVAALR